MGVYHDTTGLVLPADGLLPRGQVRPRDFKSAHRSPDFLILQLTPAPLTFAAGVNDWAVPLARTEWKGFTQMRTRYPMLYVDYVQFIANITAPGKGVISVWASADNGATWASLDGNNGPKLSLNPSQPVQPAGEDWPIPATIYSGWVKVSATVRTYVDPLLRIVGEGGDGATKTTFGNLALYGK